jgi:hypothetical protein
MGQVIRIFTDTQRSKADGASLHRATLMQCHADACHSGRIACPCPEACEVSTDAHAAAVFWRLYVVALVAVAACSYIALVVL